MNAQQIDKRQALSDAAWNANEAWFKASATRPQSDPEVIALWEAYLAAQQAAIDYDKECAK